MAGIITSIDPMALATGPPIDTVLTVYGTGFEVTSQIRFGGNLERTDHYPNDRQLSTIISQGVFPGPGTVPVSVFNPSDASDSNVVTFTFIVAPTKPPDGTVIADLAGLKQYIGARSIQDDVLLGQVLAVATQAVYDEVYPDAWLRPTIQQAILLLASRTYKRRQSPEGVAGFGGESTFARLVVGDPDFEDLIGPYRNWARVGGIA